QVLARTFLAETKGLTYMSESDYPYQFAIAKSDGKPLTAQTAMRAFMPALKREIFKGLEPSELKKITLEVQTAKDTKEYFKGWDKPGDPNDPQQVKDAQHLGRAFTLLANNLQDVRVMKVGPRDDDTGKLGVDQGLYAYL